VQDTGEVTMGKDIKILAIETSCDETSAAVVKNGREVLSNIISSPAYKSIIGSTAYHCRIIRT